MKIKEIRLYGFKSFFEETKFLLNPGITAFVGPNGSGKSNIFDALRWVFGEQSMKALRCERTEDLVHMSHDGKNDANFTEVAIIIDNEDYFPQFGGEFEIKRRYYRSGESEFFLNRVKCRLQDIQALFLNSGALTYSFLELAEIKKIIGGNTKDMFDDVSGILKYQERRDQTQRRLEATEQDLLRLEDVISEMVRSIRSLKRQARQAQLYHEIKEEYKTVSLAIMKRDHAAACGQIEALQERIRVQADQKQTRLQGLQDLEAERKAIKERIDQAESEKDTVRSALAVIDQGVDELTREIADRDERIRQLALSGERMQASMQEKQDFLTANRNRIAEFERVIAETSAERDRMNTVLEKEKTAVQGKNERFFALQDDLRSRERTAARSAEEIAAAKSGLVAIEIERKNQEALQQRISEEFQTAATDLQAGQQSVRELDAELEKITRLQEERARHLDEANHRLDDATREFSAVEGDLTGVRESVSECKVTIETLARRVGKPDTIKQVEPVLGSKLAGIFRDCLEVTPGSEAAVDACLGEVYNYLIIQGFETADLDRLPDGTIGLVNSGSAAALPEVPDELRAVPVVLDRVRLKTGRQYLERHLRGYFLVEERDRALSLSERHPWYGFVTPAGTLFKNGLIVHQKGDAGYFKISQSLQENRQRLETLQNQSKFLQDERTRLLTETEQMKADIEKEREELFTINIRKSEFTLRRDELGKRLAKTDQEASELKDDRQAVADRIAELSEQARTTVQQRDQLTAGMERLSRETAGVREAAAALEREIAADNQRINELILQAGILQERLTSVQRNHQDLIGQIAASEADLERIRQNTIRRDIDALAGAIQELKDQLAAKQEQRRAAEARLPDKLLEAAAREQAALFERLTEQQQDLDRIQHAEMQLNYEIFEHNHRREELVRKAAEEFATDLAAHAPEEIPDLDGRRQEVRERLEKLGEINPLALEAYEQEKKRLDEFFKQRNDIITAKQSLLKSIDELDGRARERFVNTFQQVKEQFNVVFANFFEGGEADLVLTDPLNPLASQVEIVVRMANKRIKTINQLSGGEQTLLAVSLLLAFYLVKPAPFCILDEIDAPLDDANVVRFNRFLRDLSQRTQVVIITHNRATMEYADYLYGLTSERPGQSKVISVKLADLESIESIPTG